MFHACANNFQMDLQNLFKKRIQQIQKLENFVVLYGKKRENLSGLCQISNEVEQTKDILVSCVNILDKFRKENNQKFTKLSKLTKHQQTIMLDVLNKLLDYEHQPQHEEELTIISENIGTPTSCKIQPFKSSLAEYIKSPYAMKRMRPLALQFTDFEKTISAEEFKIIPGYSVSFYNIYQTIISNHMHSIGILLISNPKVVIIYD